MFRIIWDAGVCLAVSVILCRFYLLESYMIQTGSMAPNLWGYHKHIRCPACEFVFSRGAYDEYSNSTAQLPACCPNCGLEPLKCDELRRTEGDQLLVNKMSYPLTPLKRWDVIVFQSPITTNEAYVKRVIALPGEELAVEHGDIYINQQIARKPLSKQRSMFITIYDDRYRSQLADSNEKYSRWWPIELSDNPELVDSALAPGWQKTPIGFNVNSTSQHAWLKYHHPPLKESAIYAVKLESWPEHLPAAESLHSHLSYIRPLQKLTFQGKLSSADLNQLLQTKNLTDGLIAALNKLHLLSQSFTQGRILTNNYAYNGIITTDRTLEDFVQDFKLDLDLETSSQEGLFTIKLTDGRHPFELILDFSVKEARLLMENNVVRNATIPADLLKKKSLHLEFSTCDAALSAAVNHHELFAPFEYTPGPPLVENFNHICKIGAQNLSASISNIILSRDVYYDVSASDLRNVYRTLAKDEIFVMGDNTPASLDSRKWPPGSLTTKLLIGKPLVVHLPSRTGEFTYLGQKKKIRLPDFSRIHWVQ
jgi:signal peptidase I